MPCSPNIAPVVSSLVTVCLLYHAISMFFSIGRQMFGLQRTKSSSDHGTSIVGKLARIMVFIVTIWVLLIFLGRHAPTLLVHDTYLEERARFERLQLATAGTFEYAPPSLPSSIEALEYTRTKSIFIAAILHNNAAYLHTTLKLVDLIGNLFETYHVGFYENDSTDGTAEILSQWGKDHPNAANIHIVSEVLKVQGAISFGGINEKRFSLLANYRNKYISMIETYAPDVDYVLMLDMDLFDTTLDAFLSSFTPRALAKNWAAAGANGIYNHRLYYDTLAFRNAEFPDTRIGRTRKLAQAVYRPDSEWIPVDSMFGGMVVYRAECMRGCRYLQDGDCEHVSFYKCMAQKGEDCKRFFINPAFVVDYQLFVD